MINFDDYTNENKTEHNLKWLYIPDLWYRIITVKGDSGSEKTNILLNVINNQQDIDKIHLHAKGPYQSKYKYLFNKREKVGLRHYDEPKEFIEYSNDIQDVYKKNIKKHNLGKKPTKLIAFDDIIADIINDKKINPAVTEFFIRGRKLNISIVFISVLRSRILKFRKMLD